MSLIIGTFRYEDGKAMTGTAVDARNLREPRNFAADKMHKMCIFVQDGKFNNFLQKDQCHIFEMI